MGAAARWAEALGEWAIPPEIRAAAPEDPWKLRVPAFARSAAAAIERDTPSRRRALEALPDGGSVLDVGCGAGAASVPLIPPATHVTGVDSSPEMLEAFVEGVTTRGVGSYGTIISSWPDASIDVAAGFDVVVCHHVLYNVAELEPFVAALADHARRRLVIELTAEHPRAWQAPLWRRFHGIERPTRPTADDAVVVMRELGLDVHVERWPVELWAANDPDLVPTIRQGLCLPPERDPEIVRALTEDPPPATRDHVTIWWDPVTDSPKSG